MIYLIVVSLIWAFSFGLIKTSLANLDPNFVSFARLFLSLVVFLPFLRIRKIEPLTRIKLIGIGTVQYGIMYIVYIYSFQHLKSYEVALFTVLTPFYITLINDIISRTFHKTFLISSVLAFTGTSIIVWSNIDTENFLWGFILVQVSNISFAAGQIFYKRVKSKLSEVSNVSIFGLLYIGAAIVSFSATLFTTDYTSLAISNDQYFAIIYLGIISSGLAFYLWNIGVTKVNEGLLAIFNNLKIPLAILVSILVFGESGNVLKLAIGGTILFSAFWINEKYTKI